MRHFYTIILSLLLILGYNNASAQDFTHTKIKDSKKSKEFLLLKDALSKTSYQKTKDFLNAAKAIDSFLDNVSFSPKSKDIRHNEILSFVCFYMGEKLSIPIYINDTLYATTGDGAVYCGYLNTGTVCLSLLSKDIAINRKNKIAVKTLNDLIKTHTQCYERKELMKRNVLFHVTNENLYYAAIPSKEIPDFDVVSNNSIVNFATCIKTILKASNIDAKYEEIIHSFLHSSLDGDFIPVSNFGDSISSKKVVVSRIPLNERQTQTIVERLCCNRFLISVDKDGTPSLLTAIALDKRNNPVHVRLRKPNIEKGKQRLQLSWDEFSHNQSMLFDISIFN